MVAAKFGYIERIILQTKRLLEHFKKENANKKDSMISASNGFSSSVIVPLDNKKPSLKNIQLSEPRTQRKTKASNQDGSPS